MHGLCVQLSADVSKESTPARELEGIGEVKVHSSQDGEEVQEVEVSVREEVKGEETPVILRHKDEGISPRTSTGNVLWLLGNSGRHIVRLLECSQ